MKYVRAFLMLVASFAVLAYAELGATRAAEVELLRQTIDGGGVMQSTDGEIELSGTIGQRKRKPVRLRRLGPVPIGAGPEIASRLRLF